MSGSEVFGLSLFSLYKIVTLLPTFAFHKPWLTESSGADQTFTNLEECTFLLFNLLPLLEVVVIPALFKIIKVTSEMKLTSLRLLGKVWKTKILTFLLSHELKNSGTKMRSNLKVLKVAHENLLGVAVKYHISMVDTFGIL